VPLFEPERHEPLESVRWNEGRAAEAIDDIVARTRAAFGHGSWPSHPNDVGPLAPAPTPSLYFGTAGIVWALAQLGVRIPNEREVLYAAAAESAAQMQSQGEEYGRGLLLGPTGPLAVASLLTGESAAVEALYPLVRANVSNSVRDFMWGSPGTMLVAKEMFGRTADARWRSVFVDSARQLESELVVSSSTGAQLWVQHLYGYEGMHVGAGHGFAGNMAPILLGRGLLDASEAERWRALAMDTAKRTARVEDGLANWPQSTEGGRPGRNATLVQWCHGAPGLIVSLAALVDGTDPEFDALMLAGGELVWRAGPLVKGAGLCHGTAGNGYAFLHLFHATRDSVWLERARGFAMHALQQYQTAASVHGDLRHSLATGDIGVALFLRACMTIDPRYPAFQYL
jgi:lantibiotic modifying enzyme